MISDWKELEFHIDGRTSHMERTQQSLRDPIADLLSVKHEMQWQEQDDQGKEKVEWHKQED